MQRSNVTAVVVSFNRLPLLKRCVDALQKQSLKLQSIVIIDNASSDGSAEWLASLPKSDPGLVFRGLNQNVGGAGGFAEGLELACRGQAEWIWMMDDDACPESGSLEELVKHAVNFENIYGSLAVYEEQTSWLLELLEDGRKLDRASDVPDLAEVGALPFLGFLIHRTLASKLGLPDAGFFIAADDLEYCMRARRSGSRIFIAGKSRIEHPRAARRMVKLFWVSLNFVELTPWKRYYDTRNRILIGHEYFGAALYYKTLPSIFVRLFFSMLFDSAKIEQLKAYVGGISDGLAKRKGMRHVRWGLS